MAAMTAEPNQLVEPDATLGGSRRFGYQLLSTGSWGTLRSTVVYPAVEA